MTDFDTYLTAFMFPRPGGAQLNFNIEDDMFAEQVAFYNEPARNAIACGSRRMGKSSAGARKMRKFALMGPEHNVYYITKSRDSGKRIMWLTLLEVCRKYKDDIVINIAELSVFFKKTKSFIWLRGANNSLDIERLRGMKLKYVLIDEAQVFTRVLLYIIEEVLEPSLVDLQGTIDLTGTPNATSSGCFYDLCHSGAWKLHHWTLHNNTFLLATANRANPSIVTGDDIIRDICLRKKLTIDSPKIRREYFGEWVKSSHLQVYDYDKVKQHYDTVPTSDFRYVLGVDLGFRDSDAIVAWAYSISLRQCYMVEELRTAKQDITGLCKQIEIFRKNYDPYLIIMDAGALGLKITSEITNRYKIPVIAAEKSRKAEFIALFNDQMNQELIKIKSDSELAQEMEIHTWDEDKFAEGIFQENRDTSNHLCDAALYSWRHIYNYLFQPEEDPIDLQTPSEFRAVHKLQEAHKKELYESGEDASNGLYNI